MIFYKDWSKMPILDGFLYQIHAYDGSVDDSMI
jgi:hypothetical protein